MRDPGHGGLDREVVIPVVDVDIQQVPVARLHGGESQQPHLLDQSVLVGPESPLDPTFGLRRMSLDQLDVEFTQGPSDVGLRSLGLSLLKRNLGHWTGPLAEVARLIRVEGDRTAPSPEIIDDDLSIRCPIIHKNEAGHEESVRRIVVQLDEHKAAGNPLLEPGMV